MGLSLGKIVVVALVVFLVWYTLKRPNLIAAVTRAVRRELRKDRRSAPHPAALAAEDLVKCPRCGAYAAVGTAACGRHDCPRSAAARSN